MRVEGGGRERKGQRVRAEVPVLPHSQEHGSRGGLPTSALALRLALTLALSLSLTLPLSLMTASESNDDEHRITCLWFNG